ncbi:hypothetical protein D3C80_1800190 [compost metagenome]
MGQDQRVNQSDAEIAFITDTDLYRHLSLIKGDVSTAAVVQRQCVIPTTLWFFYRNLWQVGQVDGDRHPTQGGVGCICRNAWQQQRRRYHLLP